MEMSTLRDVMVWALVVNYGILLVWFVVFSLAHDAVYRLHTRWHGGLQDRRAAT
jgi:hypothetical protein